MLIESAVIVILAIVSFVVGMSVNQKLTNHTYHGWAFWFLLTDLALAWSRLAYVSLFLLDLSFPEFALDVLGFMWPLVAFFVGRILGRVLRRPHRPEARKIASYNQW